MNELTPVPSESSERDGRRYQLLRAYLLLTGLIRRVSLTVSPADSDAHRYRALRDHLLSSGIMRHVKLSASEHAPFVIGKELYGETVEEALDTLEHWDHLTCTAMQTCVSKSMA